MELFDKSTLLFIFQILTSCAGIYIVFTPKMKNVLLGDLAINTSLLVCYILINDLTAGVIYIIASIKSVSYLFKDKITKRIPGGVVPIFWMILYIICGLSTLSTPTQIVPIIIACYNVGYMWFLQNDNQKMRLANASNNTAWLLYNAYVGLWIVVIMRIIVAGAGYISWWKNRKLEQNKNNTDENHNDDNDNINSDKIIIHKI